MTLNDYLNRKIPEYYDGMHRDGFTPLEILHAAHKKMLNKYKPADQQATDLENVNIKSEIKIK